MIDFNEKGKVLRHSWSNCVGAGRAAEGLRADWQEHLNEIVKNCGFRYLRFHGLLHDDMQVYTERDGEAVYNFQYIDKLFDAMLNIGIRPFVEFGFMPKALASHNQTQFWWKGQVAPPNDYEKWAELLKRCVEHWIFRYGIDEVKEWYFEIWNEPNLKVFWGGTRSEYFRLYDVSVRAIKSIDSALRVGGPATSNFVPDHRFDGEIEDTTVQQTFKVDDIDELNWHGVWIEEFLQFCAMNDLPVDFVSCHPYPTDFALDGYGECRGRSRKKDSLADDVRWLKQVIEHSAYKNAEIHLTEWSSSPSSRDYSHDFLQEAAYIVRSVLSVNESINSLSYWTFTDVFEELGAGEKPFHGGFGIINLQGIKKPAFHAFRMLNNLGQTELYRDGKSIFTKAEKGLSALFYNYPEEYKKTIPMSSYPDVSKAVECQNYSASSDYEYVICSLNPGDEYQLEIVNKNSVAINKWIENGQKSELSIEQEEKLRKVGERVEKNIFIVDKSGELHVSFTLEAWNIALLHKVKG